VPWVTSEGISGRNPLNANTPVVAYHTVLPAGSSCTPAALQQAAAANSPAVNVTALLAAEEASLALMEPRLTAALGIKDQLRAVIDAQGAPSLTFNGDAFDRGEFWLGAVGRLCFYVPPWLNNEKVKKSFELRPQNAASLWAVFGGCVFSKIDFVTNPDAVSPNAGCFNTSFITNPSAGMYSFAMRAGAGIDYVETPLFSVRHIEMKWTSASTPPGGVQFAVGWNLKIGTPMAGDKIRIRSRDGTHASAFKEISGATGLNQLGTFPMQLPVLPVGAPTQGPYLFYYHRAGSATFTASSTVTPLDGRPWSDFRL
jgi:hypothetical protein